MSGNVGSIDRVVRLLVGVALIAWALGFVPALGQVPGWGWIAGLVGAVLAVTAFVGVCPAYALLDVSTCGRRS